MQLQDFVRPPDDNGRGIHWSASIYHQGGQSLNYWVQELEAMNTKWVKILDDGGGSSTELCEQLLARGIMPVVRLYRREPNPGHIGGREEDTIRSLVARGVRYFETNNEPDLSVEWQGGHKPPNWLDIVIDHFIIDADKVLGLGGYPAVPAMGVGSQVNPVALVVERGREDLFQHGAWVAIHNYVLNHPLDYPYDSVNQEGTPLTPEEYEQAGLWAWDGQPRELINQWRAEDKNPGATVREDPSCWLAFRLADELIVEALGYSVPIISTEGGVIVGWRDDRRYPRVTPDLHLDWTVGINDFMQREAPDYYFTMCHWLIANYRMGHFAPGWESQAWYTDWWREAFGIQGELPTVQAVRDMPSIPRDTPVGTGAIAGQVVGPDGTPIAGLTVILYRELENADPLMVGTAETDAEGRFRWTELRPGTYAIGIEAWGLVRQGIEVGELETVEVTIELEEARRGRLYGRVENETGQPVPHFSLVLTEREGAHWEEATDGEANFCFEGLPVGIYTLTAGPLSQGLLWSNGWDSREVPLTVPGAGFLYRVTKKRLLPPEEGRGKHLFFGRVTDAEGNELSGIAIEMRWTGAGPGTHFPVVRTGADSTKPPGYYQFLNTPGDFSLQVMQGDWDSQVADGLQTANIPGYEGESASYEVDFCLGPWAEPLPQSVVQGNIAGAPEGAQVLLRMGAETWRATPDADGNFEIQGLPAGTGVLEIIPLGVVVRQIHLDGHNAYRIDFPVGSVVEGRLVGAEPRRLVVLHALTWGWARETRVDEEGRYRFQYLPGGEYRLVAGAVESGLIRLDGRNTVEVPPLDVSSLSRSLIEGEVLDRAGCPQPWVKISLRSADGASREAWTDSSGRFRFGGLEPGTYYLVVEGLGSLREEMQVGPREHKRLVLTTPPPKPLGRYLLLGRTAAAGTWVNLLLAYPTLLETGAACGFRVADAAQATEVLVLAGAEGVSEEEEAALVQAGCRVQQLGGDPYAVARALQEFGKARRDGPNGMAARGILQNDARAYGVRVEECEAEPGQAFWKVERVHHLTPQENRGRRHLFVECLDEAGHRVVGAKALVSWQGEGRLLPLPDATMAMAKGQEYAVRMEGLPSERVVGLQTGHPDEPVPGLPLGNTLYHHSFSILFRRATVPLPAEAAEKSLLHYVLFGPADRPETLANMLMALGYLLRFGPSFGFSGDEAAHAELVTIVADEEAVSSMLETSLRDQGCRVQRISGPGCEVEARLAELEERGTPFDTP